MAHIRMALAAFCLLLVTPIMALLHRTGLRRNGVLLSSHLITRPLQFLNVLWGVDLRCDDIETLRAHRGLILANHTTYLDITNFLALRPVRFLSATEVQSEPIIGWMTKIIGSVFIDRGSVRSAITARHELAEAVAEHFDPPFVIYPEGMVGTTGEVLPFRNGTFRIATENNLPYLLCSLHYSEPDVTTWPDPESMLEAMVRLFKHKKRIIAEVKVLEVVTPQASDKPKALAAHAHAVISASVNNHKALAAAAN